MLDFLKGVTIAGNELWRLVLFFAAVLLSLVVGRLARLFMERSARRTGVGRRELVGVVLRALSKPVVLLGVALGFWVLLYNPGPLSGGRLG